MIILLARNYFYNTFAFSSKVGYNFNERFNIIKSL